MEDQDLQEKPKPIPRYKHLLDNWLEERETAKLDGEPPVTDTYGEGRVHRHGHRGLLTTDMVSHMSDKTTTHDAYRKPVGDGELHKGKREQMMEHFLYKKFSKEAFDELNPAPHPPVKMSITHRDYLAGCFQSVPPPPTKDHDYRTEQPVTFWSENKHEVTGVSTIRTRDTPFKKSATFSTPISEYMDEPMPYTQENYPNL
ncbi:sperm-associated antigen 8 isoform X2 [Ambystoma mexicanum]